MRTPLAWFNLKHSPARTFLALAGVALAAVLIFMQLGFLGSADQSATLVYDALEFDLLLRSRHYLHLVLARSIPVERLLRAEALPGVARAQPFCVTSNQWRSSRGGQIRAILTMGVDPAGAIFRPAEIARETPRLTTPEFILIDRLSRPEFGPVDGQRFGDADIGAEAEIAGRRVRIIGHFALGTGFVADGAVLMNLQGFRRLNPQLPPGEVSLGLVTLLPEADAAEVARRLKRLLPADVDVLTRAEVLQGERLRWVWKTSIGRIFVLGVALAMVVGVAIVYLVLSTDVANRLPEYATLKAMGYGESWLAGIVLQQALLLAVGGFVPAWGLSEALYRLTGWWARIPIGMTVGRVAGVLGLCVVMCAISGLLALRKVRSADPADLF